MNHRNHFTNFRIRTSFSRCALSLATAKTLPRRCFVLDPTCYYPYYRCKLPLATPTAFWHSVIPRCYVVSKCWEDEISWLAASSTSRSDRPSQRTMGSKKDLKVFERMETPKLHGRMEGLNIVLDAFVPRILRNPRFKSPSTQWLIRLLKSLYQVPALQMCALLFLSKKIYSYRILLSLYLSLFEC
jgi:hypothetical protein